MLTALPLVLAACASDGGADSSGTEDDREQGESVRARVYVMIGDESMHGNGLIDHGTRAMRELYLWAEEGAPAGLKLSVYYGEYDPAVDDEELAPDLETVADPGGHFGWPPASSPLPRAGRRS